MPGGPSTSSAAERPAASSARAASSCARSAARPTIAAGDTDGDTASRADRRPNRCDGVNGSLMPFSRMGGSGLRVKSRPMTEATRGDTRICPGWATDMSRAEMLTSLPMTP